MRVDVHRYDPVANRKWTDTYEVSTERSMTVMDVLEEISSKMDNTLAFYRHSACNHGICARCAILVNGRARLACTEIANNYESLTLAPLAGRNMVRDLVTRR